MKSILAKFVLVFLAFSFAILLFEFGLRFFTNKPENLAKLEASSRYIYENKQNASFPYWIADNVTTQIKINSYGFRDVEFSKNKEPDTIRIAVLGDSQEEALQVDLENTWEKIMAKALTDKIGKKVETYNFGVSGYGTDQEWLTLREKVWQFSPDMVILAFSPNDVGDVFQNHLVRLKNDKIEVISPKERAGGNWLGKLLRETYIYNMVVRASSQSDFGKRVVNKIRTKFLGFPQDEKFKLSDAQLVQGPFEVIASQENPPKEVLDTWKIIRVLFSDMQSQTKAHNAKFMMTVNISISQVLPGDWDQLVARYKIDKNSVPYHINDVAHQTASSLGIEFYDPRLDAIAWRDQNGELHYKKDGHFNKVGHEFMGAKVAEFIISNKILP